MRADSSKTPRRPKPTVEEASQKAEVCLEIELDARKGLGRVVDPRLFQPARREFARSLLEALCAHPGVRKAEVDLKSATCRVEFDLASKARAVMGKILTEAVRKAATRPGKTRWWRRAPSWSTLTAYRAFGQLLLWETYENEPGCVRFVHQGGTLDRKAASRLADSLADLEGVERCKVSLWSHRITVDCAPGPGPTAGRTMSRLERVLEERATAEPTEGVSRSGAAPAGADAIAFEATTWKRLRYGAMAGGAFTLTLVGLVVPGLPTVPFLLATSYYLARSSPRLNERLRRTAFFGPILREWEGHSALGLASKGKLIALTGTIVVVTVALAPLTPLALSAILLFSSLSVLGIAKIPSLEEDAQSEVAARPHTSRPLPAL